MIPTNATRNSTGNATCFIQILDCVGPQTEKPRGHTARSKHVFNRLIKYESLSIHRIRDKLRQYLSILSNLSTKGNKSNFGNEIDCCRTSNQLTLTPNQPLWPQVSPSKPFVGTPAPNPPPLALYRPYNISPVTSAL